MRDDVGGAVRIDAEINARLQRCAGHVASGIAGKRASARGEQFFRQDARGEHEPSRSDHALEETAPAHILNVDHVRSPTPAVVEKFPGKSSAFCAPSYR